MRKDPIVGHMPNFEMPRRLTKDISKVNSTIMAGSAGWVLGSSLMQGMLRKL